VWPWPGRSKGGVRELQDPEDAPTGCRGYTLSATGGCGRNLGYGPTCGVFQGSVGGANGCFSVDPGSTARCGGRGLPAGRPPAGPPPRGSHSGPGTRVPPLSSTARKNKMKNKMKITWPTITAGKFLQGLHEVDVYLGPLAEWESLPANELPDRLRDRGWDVKDSDVVVETVKQMVTGTLPKLKPILRRGRTRKCAKCGTVYRNHTKHRCPTKHLTKGRAA